MNPYINGNGNPQRDYIYLNGEPLALKIYGTQAGMYWFINDHLGTPQKIVNSSAQMMWSAAYLPFGKAQVTTGTVENNLRFPGQYYDAESGLHYNGYRYYDPETGRYITADPIGLSGGINLYVYVMGNPVNRVDPWGLDTIRIITNGQTIVLTGKNNDDIRKTLSQMQDNSISYFEIVGHANPGGIDTSKSDFIYYDDQDGVIYSDNKSSFADSIRRKLQEGATIYLRGCNTARQWGNNTDNITRKLSEELTDIYVKGYRGFGFSNEVSNPFNRDQVLFRVGQDMSSVGIPRTYLNGKPQ